MRQNWKDLPISAVVSEHGYVPRAARLTSGRERRLAPDSNATDDERKTFRPEVDIKWPEARRCQAAEDAAGSRRAMGGERSSRGGT